MDLWLIMKLRQRKAQLWVHCIKPSVPNHRLCFLIHHDSSTQSLGPTSKMNTYGDKGPVLIMSLLQNSQYISHFFQNKGLMSLCGVWDLPLHEPYTPGKWNWLHWPLLCYNILTFSASTHSSFALECSPPHLSRVKSFHFSRPFSLVVSLGKLFLTSLLEIFFSCGIWFPPVL